MKILLTSLLVMVALVGSITTQTAFAGISRPAGLTDEQLKQRFQTDFRSILDNVNSSAETLLIACGEAGDVVKHTRGIEGTFTARVAEKKMQICDHDMLYYKGMCMSWAQMFNFCGESSLLQDYLKSRNLEDAQPEKTFLNYDGSVNDAITNESLNPSSQ
jgi:hypothetical protein